MLIPSAQACPPTTFHVLGQRVDALTLQDAVDELVTKVERAEKTYFTFCTASSILARRDDQAVGAAFENAGLVAPDGMPLVWLARRAGRRVERVYGPDFMLEVMTRFPGLSHFFYGGNPGVADELVERLRIRFPGFKLAGVLSPGEVSGTEVEAHEIDVINASRADVVWVGLGHPKQELWMQAHREFLETPVLAGVGAAFDFLSGRKREAPEWIKRSGLQWLHRLASDPRRLWRRYLVGNVRFLTLLVHERLAALRL